MWYVTDAPRFTPSFGFTDGAEGKLDLHWNAMHWSCQPGADEDFWTASVPVALRGVSTRALCRRAAARDRAWSAVEPYPHLPMGHGRRSDRPRSRGRRLRAAREPGAAAAPGTCRAGRAPLPAPDRRHRGSRRRAAFRTGCGPAATAGAPSAGFAAEPPKSRGEGGESPWPVPPSSRRSRRTNHACDAPAAGIRAARHTTAGSPA